MRALIQPILQSGSPAATFAEYLHVVRENERVELARKLHDEIGGFLVSAAIDLGWVESHAVDSEFSTRLRRLGVHLAGAIDMNRIAIEQLRPTLLDNIGLFEALRWYFRHACHHVDAKCSETFPSDEFDFSPSALSHIFRATQSLLDCTFTEEALRTVDFGASIQGGSLLISLGHEHLGRESADILARFPHELGSAAHRAAACGGHLSLERLENGTVFYLKLPLVKVANTL